MRQGVADAAQANIEVLNTVDGTVSFVSPSHTDDQDSTMEAHVPVVSGGMAGPYPTGAFMSVSNGTVMDGALFPNISATVPGPTTPGTPGTPSKTFLEIFICFFCEKEFKDRPMLQKHQEECSMRQVKLQVSACPPRTLRHRKQPQTISRRSKPPPFSPYRTPDKSVFTDSLGLLHAAKADTFIEEKCKEVDCEIIDLEEDPVPKTPTTPRSAKSLISQLSRDLSPTSVSRMALDFGESKTKERNREGSDSDSESSKSENGEGEFRPAKAASLLAIDFCSPLGQRVKKHIIEKDEEEDASSQDGYEVYCHTPKKNNFLDRLRHRQSYYPVTYRKKRSLVSSHQYKFSKRQRVDFMNRMRSGLNKKSQKRKRQMKKCKVLLQKMSSEDIKKWTEKQMPIIDLTRLSERDIAKWKAKRKEEGYVFPGGSSPLLNNGSELRRLLGLRTQKDYQQMSPRSRYLTLSQMLSEDANAEMTQQKLMLYKTLLSEAQGRPMSVHGSPPQGWSSGITNLSRFYGSSGMKVNNSVNTSNLAAMLTKARRRRQSNQSDDVISISSCDSDDNKSTSGRSHRSNDMPPPSKRRKMSSEDNAQSKSHAVLFKCHLCYQEILFNLSTTDFIKNHFSEKHNVHNIQILEHRDQNNQVVLSIVENNKTKPPPGGSSGQGPARRPRATRSKGASPPSEVICID